MIKDLSVRLKKTGEPIVRNMSFSIEEGKSLIILGQSGSGKTMTCQTITGVLNRRLFAPSGEVLFKGQELLSMRPQRQREIYGAQIALIPQNPMTASIGSLDDAALVIASQLSEIGFKLTPSGTDMMTWFGAIQAGAYEITIYLTYGGAYDPTTVVTNINPETSTDPIAVQVSSELDGGNTIITELNSTSDMERVQTIYTELLGSIAEQSLMVPVSYTREFAAWKSKTISGYDFTLTVCMFSLRTFM